MTFNTKCKQEMQTITMYCKQRRIYVYKHSYWIAWLHSLWNPEVQCRIHKDSPIIPILSRINPISRIDTYFFKIHSKDLFPVGLPVKILKALLPSCILAAWPAHLNLRELDLLTSFIIHKYRHNPILGRATLGILPVESSLETILMSNRIAIRKGNSKSH